MRIFTTALLGTLVLAACSGGEDAGAPAEVSSAEGGIDAGTQEAGDAPSAAVGAGEDIRRFLLQNYPDAAPGQYALAWHDLNGDGVDEAIVHLATSYFCGTGGCNTLVLTPAGAMWSEVANISVSRPPIGVAETSTKGWQDLTVAVGGGGGAPGIALLKFDGEGYPENPTVEPAQMTGDAGTQLLAEDPEMIRLEAGDAPAD